MVGPSERNRAPARAESWAPERAESRHFTDTANAMLDPEICLVPPTRDTPSNVTSRVARRLTLRCDPWHSGRSAEIVVVVSFFPDSSATSTVEPLFVRSMREIQCHTDAVRTVGIVAERLTRNEAGTRVQTAGRLKFDHRPRLQAHSCVPALLRHGDEKRQHRASEPASPERR
jgi:hypothetical protein